MLKRGVQLGGALVVAAIAFVSGMKVGADTLRWMALHELQDLIETHELEYGTNEYMVVSYARERIRGLP